MTAEAAVAEATAQSDMMRVYIGLPVAIGTDAGVFFVGAYGGTYAGFREHMAGLAVAARWQHGGGACRCRAVGRAHQCPVGRSIRRHWQCPPPGSPVAQLLAQLSVAAPAATSGGCAAVPEAAGATNGVEAVFGIAAAIDHSRGPHICIGKVVGGPPLAEADGAEHLPLGSVG